MFLGITKLLLKA